MCFERSLSSPAVYYKENKAKYQRAMGYVELKIEGCKMWFLKKVEALGFSGFFFVVFLLSIHIHLE